MCIGHCIKNVCNDEGICYECMSGYYGEHCNWTCVENCTSNHCDREFGTCAPYSISTVAIALAVFALVFICLSIALCVYVYRAVNRYPRYPPDERSGLINNPSYHAGRVGHVERVGRTGYIGPAQAPP